MPATSTAASPARRHDLDWIRVGAFFLLILYHVGVFYESEGWHVVSPRRVEDLKMVMSLSSPWRLMLLFVIAGMATRFMADTNSVGRLALSRSWRLLVPLVFSMLVVVPPQTWYEVLEQGGPALPVWDFYRHYIVGDHDWGITTPTWNHMWFVAYLWVYTVALALMLAVAGGPVRRLGTMLSDAMSGRSLWLLGGPIAILFAARQLEPVFDSTHALTDDWYNHSQFASAFLFGFLVARSEAMRDALTRWRWLSLGLALGAWLVWQAYLISWVELPGGTHFWTPLPGAPPQAFMAVMGLPYAVFQWTAIAALMGFGARHLNRGGPFLTYLTVAVFPLYILHQTITVVAAHHLARIGLPLAIEAGLLIAITFLGAFAGYEVIRRVAILRPLFGLKFKSEAGYR